MGPYGSKTGAGKGTNRYIWQIVSWPVIPVVSAEVINWLLSCITDVLVEAGGQNVVTYRCCCSLNIMMRAAGADVAGKLTELKRCPESPKHITVPVERYADGLRLPVIPDGDLRLGWTFPITTCADEVGPWMSSGGRIAAVHGFWVWFQIAVRVCPRGYTVGCPTTSRKGGEVDPSEARVVAQTRTAAMLWREKALYVTDACGRFSNCSAEDSNGQHASVVIALP
jgi:hypothetical protein